MKLSLHTYSLSGIVMVRLQRTTFSMTERSYATRKTQRSAPTGSYDLSSAGIGDLVGESSAVTTADLMQHDGWCVVGGMRGAG